MQILCIFLRNKHYFVHHFSTSFLRKLYNSLRHFSAGIKNNVNLLFPSHKSVLLLFCCCFVLFVSQLCFLRVGLCYIPTEPSTLICTIPIIYLILYNKSDSLEQKYWHVLLFLPSSPGVQSKNHLLKIYHTDSHSFMQIFIENLLCAWF